MALSTKNIKTTYSQKPTPSQRTERTTALLKYHEPAFNILGVTQPSFYPKVIFMWQQEPHVSLFENELTTKVFFTEFVNDDYSPSDDKRTLYKFLGGNDCIGEYYKNNEGQYPRYYVPLIEFQKVELNGTLFDDIEIKFDIPKKKTEPKAQYIPPPEILDIEENHDRETDALMSKMTIRDHAAIEWKLPVSNKTWLNELINKVNGK
jgi:hypothetical protein